MLNSCLGIPNFRSDVTWRWLMRSLIALALSELPLAGALGATIYVSPGGSDAWSGSAPEYANSGDGPLATPGKALEVVRRLKTIPGVPAGGHKIILRGGTYFLSSPLTITSQDSGTAENPNSIEAFPGETPILSGGHRLAGWKAGPSGRWTLKIPEVAAGEWEFSELFAGEERRFPSKLPKRGYYKTSSELSPTVAAKGKGYDRFGYSGSEIEHALEDTKSVLIKLFLNWSSASFRIAEINTAEKWVRVQGKTQENWYKLPVGTRFQLENVRDALTEAGEFFLDRRTGILTYFPVSGEDPDRTVLIAPRLQHLLIISASERTAVKSLRIEGLTLAHQNWVLPDEGSALGQSAIGMPAAVLLVGAEDVAFDHVIVRNVGGHGIVFGPGCEYNRVSNAVLYDLGGGGLLIGGAAATGPYAVRSAGLNRTETSHNMLKGNKITEFGKINPSASGIWIGDSGYNTVDENEISNSYYTGISVGWSWGYGASKAVSNQIINNFIHDIGQSVLSDLGGIYTLGISTGTVIKNNTIANVSGYSYGGFGIYLDEGSSDIVVEDNLIFDTSDAGLAINYGRGLIVRNNIFALARNAQLWLGKAEDHTTLSFERNIVYWYGPEYLLHGPWKEANVLFNSNVYWNSFGGISKVSDNLSLDDWRNKSRDFRSVVSAPLFSSLTVRGFALQSDSPATKLGFVTFKSR